MEKKLIGNERDFFFLLSENCCKGIMHVMCKPQQDRTNRRKLVCMSSIWAVFGGKGSVFEDDPTYGGYGLETRSYSGVYGVRISNSSLLVTLGCCSQFAPVAFLFSIRFNNNILSNNIDDNSMH